VIRLTLDDDSLGAVRLAFSPLWEVMGSLGILARYRGTVPSPYTDWARRVRGQLPEKAVQVLADELRHWDGKLGRPGLALVPDPARNSLGAELAYLREATRGHPAVVRITGLLEEYWKQAIAPYWPSIRSSLEDEILFRGRALALGGPELMFAELGGRVIWSRPVLTAPFHYDLEVPVTRSRFMLVPIVFAGGIRLFLQEDDMVAMSYQARGTGYFRVLTTRPALAQADDRLALLLGRGRAQVVRALDAPATTTDVAESLGMAKSTVSQHLAVLSDAGIVWKQRLGGRVFYQLDQSGLVLLRQLDR
jgi:DNA-binding MarR family transcriptional regulator